MEIGIWLQVGVTVKNCFPVCNLLCRGCCKRIWIAWCAATVIDIYRPVVWISYACKPKLVEFSSCGRTSMSWSHLMVIPLLHLDQRFPKCAMHTGEEGVQTDFSGKQCIFQSCRPVLVCDCSHVYELLTSQCE